MFNNRTLRNLIIPLIIEQFLAVMMGMADSIMVSSVGEAAISGVSLVDSINILIINILAALGTGGAVVAAQYLGKGDNENASKSAKQLFQVAFFFAIVLSAVVLLFNESILSLIFGHVDSKVMEYAITYFFFSAISFPFLAIYNSGAGLFRSMGNSKVSMVISIFTNIVNIVGNYILIFPLNMGVAGAAIATLVSRMLGAIIILVLFSNKDNQISVHNYAKLEFDGGMIKKILSVGVPSGLENGVFQIGKILVQGLTATFGISAIAANSVAGNLSSFCTIPAAAIGLSMVTIVGQCMGANKPEEAAMYMKRLLKYAYIAMFVTCIVTYLTLPIVINIYNLSAETGAIVQELTLTFCIASALLWPVAFTFPNGLRAANDAKFTMIASIVSMWIFRVAMAYLLANTFNLGLMGVWYAMYIDWIFRALCFVSRFISGKWKTKRLI